MNNIELLLPAGNIEKMRYAFSFGADAVYLGMVDFSLRTMRKGELITKDNLKIAIDEARRLNKKAYLTLNIFSYDDDIKKQTLFYGAVHQCGGGHRAFPAYAAAPDAGVRRFSETGRVYEISPLVFQLVDPLRDPAGHPAAARGRLFFSGLLCDGAGRQSRVLYGYSSGSVVCGGGLRCRPIPEMGRGVGAAA